MMRDSLCKTTIQIHASLCNCKLDDKQIYDKRFYTTKQINNNKTILQIMVNKNRNRNSFPYESPR